MGGISLIRSMTGFGQAERTADGFRVQIDLKSVNHRYCEIAVRMPREWLPFEDGLRKTIQQSVRRGRVDVFVTVERDSSRGRSVEIDWPLAEGYLQAARELQSRFGLEGSLGLKELLQIPDLIRPGDDSDEASDTVERELQACAADAVSALVRMREAEGGHLRNDLIERLAAIRSLHADIGRLAPQSAEDNRNKLRQKLQELLDGIPLDEQRLATEAAFMAERINIDEELTRLDSHFRQFSKLLESDEPAGRKLDFLIQEMNREVNTIGSKSNHAEIAVCVIDMKAELEKMREQVQNIE